MKFNEYQKATHETVKESIKGNINYFVLGLCGETGEVADKIKKGLRDGGFNTNDIKAELGDVMWYLAQLSNSFGFTLEDIARSNLDKLYDRKSRNKISGSGDSR